MRISRGADTTARARFPKRQGRDRARADPKLGAVGCMRLLGSAGHRTQPCRDALPRPAGPAALPRKTVLDGPAALVAAAPYGCGPRTEPQKHRHHSGPPAVASLGAP